MNIAKSTGWRASCRFAATLFHALCLTLAVSPAFSAAPATAQPALTTHARPTQQSFTSPQEGAAALAKAIKTNDQALLRRIFGAGSGKLFSSGDTVADARSREHFSKAYDEFHDVVSDSATLATLVIGQDQWPMPIPLVKHADGWRFDTPRGEEEILKRRIGRNEIETMRTCLEIVDAQHEFATHHLKAGIPVYASRFISRPGKRDGLYWPTGENEAPSPLGALLAAAADEHYARGVLQREPYHGYYYRLLIAQGKDAPSGARNYLIRGKLIGGFAVIAYPARYGTSGVMTFMVNHNGETYEKDLGRHTERLAAMIRAFNPGKGWQKVKAP